TLLHKINAGFDALQIKAPRGNAIPVVSTTSTASKPEGSSTSTASGAPARSAQTTTPGRTLPNTGAKSRKRTQEASEDASASKKQ
ncbi:hypothetical protein A2U01_0055497, partial [Trifolium medium]|nr:hypothetical protein [Trifolium medium]